MVIDVFPDGRLVWKGRVLTCALGRSGVATEKREGDGATPLGCFPLREVRYRADRLEPPVTSLPLSPIRPEDGWCDDPADPLYNRPVPLPYPARHERLWREDSLYDVVVVLGYNDDPVTPGLGSAIFLHIARGAYEATEGCVALTRADLLEILRDCDPRARLCVHA